MNHLNEDGELISVIIPVYNIENHLPRCLDALSAQTYKNVEIILVDDASTDNSGIICDDFAAQDTRTRVIHHEKNMGLWAARNTGQDVSHGAYIWFPDGDDYFHRDVLKFLYEVINWGKNGEKYQIALTCGRRTTGLFEDTKSAIQLSTTEYSQKELISSLLTSETGNGLYRGFPNVWNKLYRKELIHSIRANNYPRAQDLDFNLRVFLKVKKAIVIENALYFWVQRPGSLMRSPEARQLYPQCRTSILFNNLMDLPDENSSYRYLLLKKLYNAMILWKGIAMQTEQQKGVFKQCDEYERITRKQYYRCNQIPIYERISRFILLHSPRLARFLMKLTRNY